MVDRAMEVPRSGSSPPLPGLHGAAELLTAPGALMQLNLDEARTVVRYMTARRIAADTTFICEGDTADDGFMALLLDGEVVVESIVVSRTEPVTIKVLGPGSLVGEVGLMDKEPRSASCTASTDVTCAILTRAAIEALIDAEPRVGAKLLLAISARLAQRLRDNARKLKLYAKLAQAMSQEMDVFIRSPAHQGG
jgi:CRP/FNR family cyclic AMP-dependent transcriptional regulator